ncbi:MAG: response regulator transcription factor [Myxococcales bacterium]|nr:response regulator transcription factor [Myxococcales bacterium]
MAETVLVVDDEVDLVETLSFNLQQAGYATRTATNGKQALQTLASPPRPDLVILDLMLPDMSGNDICKHLRSDPATRELPVIMLTARGDEIDRVLGLELGADDYVVKPFSVRELLLRVKAVLRRGTSPEGAAGTRSFGCLKLDTDAHRIWVEGEEITLTALEFRLVTTLLDRKGRVQSREGLLEEVWHMPAELTTRTVDTHVKRLRQKLKAAGPYIQTVRGVGYRFVDHPDKLD